MIRAGNPAPDLELRSLAGDPVRLSSAWSERPALLVFVRHFGCVFCRQQVVDLRSNADKLRALDVTIALVTMGTPAETTEFVAKYRWPFEAFCDPELAAYHAYGLSRVTRGELVASGVAAVKATLGGAMQGRTHGGDAKQMPGLFLVGTDGTVRYAHEFRHAGDHPPARELLRILPPMLKPAPVR